MFYRIEWSMEDESNTILNWKLEWPIYSVSSKSSWSFWKRQVTVTWLSSHAQPVPMQMSKAFASEKVIFLWMQRNQNSKKKRIRSGPITMYHVLQPCTVHCDSNFSAISMSTNAKNCPNNILSNFLPSTYTVRWTCF